MCKSKLNINKTANRKIIFLAIAVVFLSGCAVKLIYNQLDWAIPWYLSDYMSLNGRQEAVFEAGLDRYLDWHRKTQLPIYGGFLNKVAGQLEQGMDEAAISDIKARSEALGFALVERLAPDMVLLFQEATDPQLAQLFEKFAADNQEYREVYIEASERAQRKQRAKEVRRFIERWTGGLSEKQRLLIREGTNRYQLMGAEFLDAKLAWQAEFRRILALRHKPDEYPQQLTALLLSEGFGQSDAFKRKLAHNQKVLEQLYIELDKSLSKRQRHRAVKTLRGYAEDFYELAGL